MEDGSGGYEKAVVRTFSHDTRADGRQYKEEGCPYCQYREQVQSVLLCELFMGFALSGWVRILYNKE